LAWDGTADERRQHEGGGGCSKVEGAPKRWPLAKVHSTTMSRVHDEADESVDGKWVGRSLELVENRTAAAAAARRHGGCCNDRNCN
jgi:hypothetical protein